MSRKKQFKAPEYVYFVFTRGTNAHYGFSTYVDTVGALGVPGAPVFISYQKDKKGEQIPYHFSVSIRDRAIKVEKNKVDANGTSVVEFLRNHPECKDSPNGDYIIDPVSGQEIQTNMFFKEMNEEADAQAAIKAKDFRRKAENIAAELDLEDVVDINAICGIFKKGELLSRHAIMELAGNRPDVFMDAYENPQRKALALIRKGVEKQVLKINGAAVVWNKTTLGIDEIDAATSLQKDSKLMNALEQAIKKVS